MFVEGHRTIQFHPIMRVPGAASYWLWSARSIMIPRWPHSLLRFCGDTGRRFDMLAVGGLACTTPSSHILTRRPLCERHRDGRRRKRFPQFSLTVITVGSQLGEIPSQRTWRTMVPPGRLRILLSDSSVTAWLSAKKDA